MIRTLKIKCLLLFLIIIPLTFSGCVDTDVPKETNGLTAMEAKEIADVYAMNWSDQSVFVWFRGYSDTKGFAGTWFFVYAIETNINNITESLEFKVEKNETPIKIRNSNLTYIGNASINWTIDSPEALSIAENNETISEWLKGKSISSVYMSFGINKQYSENPIWGIKYSYYGWHPKHIEITIDAKTGEHIEVE